MKNIIEIVESVSNFFSSNFSLKEYESIKLLKSFKKISNARPYNLINKMAAENVPLFS